MARRRGSKQARRQHRDAYGRFASTPPTSERGTVRRGVSCGADRPMVPSSAPGPSRAKGDARLPEPSAARGTHCCEISAHQMNVTPNREGTKVQISFDKLDLTMFYTDDSDNEGQLLRGKQIRAKEGDENFDVWWSKAADSVSSTTRKGLNSIIILGAWTLWKHRNDCVFNGVSPNLSTALVMAGEEIRWWDMAGARALSLLTDQEGDVGD